MTGATSGAGTAYPSRVPEFTSGFKWGSYYSIFSFILYVLSIVICPFVLFLLAIVLSGLLQYTVFDYLPLVSSNSSCAYLTTFAFLMPGEQFRLPRASKLKYRHTFVFITLHPLRLKKRHLLLYLCPPL